MPNGSYQVVIDGSGPAGLTAARMLARQGASVVLKGSPPNSQQTIAIPLRSLRLAADIWQEDPKEFICGPVTKYRHVAWGNGEFDRVDEPALICNIACLTRRLYERAASLGSIRIDEVTSRDREAWRLDARGRGLNPGHRHMGGRRAAILGKVEDGGLIPRDSTFVASTPEGWLFAAPISAYETSVFLVVPKAEQATEDALCSAMKRLWPDVPTTSVQGGSTASVAPSMSTCVARYRFLEIGDRALSLDPIRGDGFGYAIRGAILAQAVIAGFINGTVGVNCLAHYRSRLGDAFRSHLRFCVRHYTDACNSAIWADDIAEMKRVLGMLASESEKTLYRLENDRLVEVGGPFLSSEAGITTSAFSHGFREDQYV